ncbi:hypothetical protein LOY57_11020 [Pseudomonas moraviensis]|uniref:hypothetical protein n=1 Tax=Pseudomonas moraviensis TaxID=321662 RepID=UPI00215F39FB|nr:hypothetical protein [Pseudomonas moraviensis]UVL48839.1 hypothetical protein LOY57_11020 [Pseudomonas moraviensis]
MNELQQAEVESTGTLRGHQIVDAEDALSPIFFRDGMTIYRQYERGAGFDCRGHWQHSQALTGDATEWSDSVAHRPVPIRIYILLTTSVSKSSIPPKKIVLPIKNEALGATVGRDGKPTVL